MTPILRSIRLFAILCIAILLGAVVGSAVPAEAQSTAAPPTNIRVVNGFNPGEVIITWSAAHGANHYRVGCVNMHRDYPRAKATNTGRWQQAFVYSDLDAPNLGPSQPTHTIYGLQEGAYHACTVLSNSSPYGRPTWPNAPFWQYLTVTNHGGSCPTASSAPVPTPGTPLSNAALQNLVKPALASLSLPTPIGNIPLGTGFVVRSDGLVVTNRHVVADYETITARMATEAGEQVEFSGRVLGTGILTDLAVIQLSSNRSFNTLELGDSDNVAFGDQVTAWGFPISTFLGDDPTLTRGIISSPNRIFEDTDYLQTDAAINPGNSGGPLINQYGQVIGVNTSKVESSIRTIDNISLSIASNEVSDRLSNLIAGGPSVATYLNLRFGYGYSMDIPRGWYLDQESGQVPPFILPSGLQIQITNFAAYGEQRAADIQTFPFFAPYGDSSGELAQLAGYYWNVALPDQAEGEEWDYFERGPARPATVAGHQFFRLEYRARYEEDDCIRSHVALVGISSDFPNKPNGFVATNATCQDVLSTYGAEQERMLTSFRP